ncbi:N-acetylmuramoyl-L-alanine amidase family protein [Maribacter litoralis]|uniref:N-acetylmuramoyl-L-alanine amidase family protein n=1 Tax=Maribacter litoralis TaxID=2059726 RepID=UPI003D2884D9
MGFLKYVIAGIIYVTLLSLSYGQNTDKLIMVIDPGHGGIDTGAVGVNGVFEKDIVLSIAKKIDSLNANLFDDRFEIYLTRYRDTLISLSDRSELAKKLNADIFISIHCNKAINRTASGTEVFIHPKSELQAEESAYLGFTIQKGLANVLGIKNRDVKFGNFQVLRDNHNSSAVILLELGFLSQTDEAIYLSQEESQNAIALVILQSIVKTLLL